MGTVTLPYRGRLTDPSKLRLLGIDERVVAVSGLLTRRAKSSDVARGSGGLTMKYG
jgi:hypothetical protein